MKRVHTILNSLIEDFEEQRELLMIILIAGFVILLPDLLCAQNHEREEIEQEIEQAMEMQGDEVDETGLQNLLEELELLSDSSIDLNSATIDQLALVPGLSSRIAHNIIRFRDENGRFDSVDELLKVPGIGPVTLEKIRPYLSTSSPSSRRFLQPEFWTVNGRLESYSRFRQVLQQQEGYQRPDTLGGYIGSPVNLYQRIRYSSRHLSVNTTLNKSPGEPYHPPVDFAFTSWHVALKGLGKLKSLVVGDFAVSYGQGLLLWTGGAFGKSSNVIRGIAKNDRGIRPSSSAQPTSGLKGIAVNTEITKRLSFSGFYSNRKRTSTVVDDQRVNFPSSTGRHRTLNELQRKNNLSQQTVGGRLSLQLPAGHFGFTAYRNRFDKEIANGSQPYQRYNFAGNQLTGISSDVRYYIGEMHLFGEIAMSDNKGKAILAGADIQLSESTTLVTAFRDYAKNFQSIFGSGFGEQSGAPRNEQGVYLGIRHQLTAKIRMNIYTDHFHFPAPRFQTRQPTSGYDWLIQLEYSHSRQLQLYLLTRFKQREAEIDGVDPFGRVVRWIKNQYRFNTRLHLEYRVHSKLRLRLRTDFVQVQPPGADVSTGILIYTDLRFYPLSRLRLDLRLTMFDTDDYESRVFQFENDLLFVMTNTMLYDTGQRLYLLLHYQLSQKIDFWFKLSTTLYENRHIIGSGLDQITGNRKSDFGFQARIRL